MPPQFSTNDLIGSLMALERCQKSWRSNTLGNWKCLFDDDGVKIPWNRLRPPIIYWLLSQSIARPGFWTGPIQEAIPWKRLKRLPRFGETDKYPTVTLSKQLFWRYQALMSRRTFSNLMFGASWTLAFPCTAENSIRPPLGQHIQMLANWSGEEEKEWALFWSIHWVIKRGGALRGAVIPLEYYMIPIAAILPKITPVIRKSCFRIIGPRILKTGFWSLNPPLISHRSNCWRLKSTIAWPK